MHLTKHEKNYNQSIRNNVKNISKVHRQQVFINVIIPTSVVYQQR